MPSNEIPNIATRRLGRTGVSVTELGLGTAPLGDLWDVVEEEEANGLLTAAWEGGVRYFDTSPWYGKGQAEHRVGRALIESRATKLSSRAKSAEYCGVLSSRRRSNMANGLAASSSMPCST